MRKAILALLAVGLTAASVALADEQHRRFLQPNLQQKRGGPPHGLFELAPSSMAGMGTIIPGFGVLVCTCANLTGAHGESVTFARNSHAMCWQGSSLVTGVAPGDFFFTDNDCARVARVGAAFGVVQEKGTTNDCLRSDQLDDAAWTATATVAADSEDFEDPTLSERAEVLTDSSGAALQGVCQTITTTSATKHAVSVYVQAGTVTSATISMTGTGDSTGDCSNAITGLSTTTWDRVSCGSATAYGGSLTAVTVCIKVGSTAAAQGSIQAWGFQHEVNHSHPSTYYQTGAAALTRAAESSFKATLPAGFDDIEAAGSASLTFVPFWEADQPSIAPYFATFSAAARLLYSSNGTNVRMYDNTNEISRNTTYTKFTPIHFWSSWTGSTLTINNGGGSTTGSFDGTMGTNVTTVDIGGYATDIEMDGIITGVCVDPSPTVCR